MRPIRGCLGAGTRLIALLLGMLLGVALGALVGGAVALSSSFGTYPPAAAPLAGVAGLAALTAGHPEGRRRSAPTMVAFGLLGFVGGTAMVWAAGTANGVGGLAWGLTDPQGVAHDTVDLINQSG